ncbi:hypothetical protein [Streptomyces sp. bgisy126]|uniref:hypothetical protein n=1 Tax=unclassified Streptomyces TaxID=2593676 RepID=UPI003EBB5AAE
MHETPGQACVAFATRDDDTRVDVPVEPFDELRGSELFADLAEASRFFQDRAKGYSATHSGRHLVGMELHTDAWHVEAGRVRSAASPFFDDPDRFP